MIKYPIPEATTITRIDEHCYLFDFFISHDLIYFPGHFPAQSILPGVVVIDWCMHLAEQYFAIKPHFESMEVIKFKQLIVPNTTITIELKYQAEKNKLAFNVTSAKGEHNSGKITLLAPMESVQP
jgi:3-hydroxymyristoyl/3-hydroxydecanoyl-(acyl carrier protein) dehydratase